MWKRRNSSPAHRRALGGQLRTIGFPFPASFGVRDGVVALILIDGDTWYQLPVK
jgi:hypothetical protein